MGISTGHALEPKKIVVYNWTEYLPEGALDAFTQESGIEVEYQTYTSNEEMYARVKSQDGAGIDVIVPSTYYISKMQTEGLLQTLDLTRIYNFHQLTPGLLNRSFDPGNKFSLPYLWGSTGIGINTAKIDPNRIHSWADLWNPEWAGRVMLTDDVREVFHVGLSMKGYSTNTQDAYEIRAAFRQLRTLMPSVSVIDGDSPGQIYLDGKADIGMIWSGEAFQANQQNPAIEYIYPEEGAVFWIDSFAIPANSKNSKEAHRFIDFMIGMEMAIRSVEELGYATANGFARSQLPEDIRNNPIIFPDPERVAKGEFQEDPGTEATQLLDSYWQRLRKEIQQPSPATATATPPALLTPSAVSPEPPESPASSNGNDHVPE
ncbi:MAG: extracellular solute-binding protein [Thiolinea sp.]